MKGARGPISREGPAGYSPVSILSAPKPSPEGNVVLCQSSCQEREGLPSSWFHSKSLDSMLVLETQKATVAKQVVAGLPGQMTQEVWLILLSSSTYG